MPAADVPQRTPSSTGRRRALRRGVDAAAVLLLCGSAAGWLSAWHWMLDLTTHFRHYWFALALGGLAVATLTRRWPAAAILAVATVINATDLAPYWVPQPIGHVAGDAQPVRLITMNVRRVNRDTAGATAYLRAKQPDVAAVLEVDARWAEALETLADLFPHRVIVPRSDNFGIAVLSRDPLTDTRIVEFTARGYPSVVTTVLHGSGAFRLIATHPYPPFDGATWATLGAHLRGVAAEASRGPLPAVVVGDLNATPWSHPFRRLLVAGGLVDSALGRGVQATYRADLPAPRIPIDHVLVPPATTVLRRVVGPANGSDHFAVEADVVLP